MEQRHTFTAVACRKDLEAEFLEHVLCYFSDGLFIVDNQDSATASPTFACLRFKR
jgi:hypothetical protein